MCATDIVDILSIMEVNMPKNNPECPSYKQHVSISQLAYSIIQSDAITFEGKTNDSGTINRIILSYKNHGFNTDTIYPINREKIDLKIRLNKIQHSYLYEGDSWKHLPGIQRQGEFIRTLIENYARSAFYQREQIYYADDISKIKKHIETHQVISITTVQKQTYIVKPYRISSDHESQYNYLIGFSKENNNSSYKPASFRISRIQDINPERNVIEDLTPDEQKILDEEAREKGVEFVLGEFECFKVKLTPQGKRLYDTIFHLRPMYEKQLPKDDDGNIVMTFRCTRLQLVNYFFQFGANAIILSPAEVQADIKEKYGAALRAYENNS